MYPPICWLMVKYSDWYHKSFVPAGMSKVDANIQIIVPDDNNRKNQWCGR